MNHVHNSEMVCDSTKSLSVEPVAAVVIVRKSNIRWRSSAHRMSSRTSVVRKTVRAGRGSFESVWIRCAVMTDRQPCARECCAWAHVHMWAFCGSSKAFQIALELCA